MYITAQKEAFSNAYLRAVTAVAGYPLSKPDPDDDSIDWTIYGSPPRRPRLDVQLKCTAAELELFSDSIPVRLKLKNYDDLRGLELMSPRLLVAMVVPTDVGDWIVQDSEQLLMRKCAYWHSLKGNPDLEDQETVTVHVPAKQLLTVDALHAIMERVASGGDP